MRDAIRKLEPVLPELAAHLQRNIVTGTYCRYRPELTHWEVDLGSGSGLARDAQRQDSEWR